MGKCQFQTKFYGGRRRRFRVLAHQPPLGFLWLCGIYSRRRGQTTLEFGTVYHLSKRDRFTLGLKFSSVLYEFDSGDEQKQKTNGLFIGYSHYFPF